METEMIFTWQTGVAIVLFMVLIKPAGRLFLRLTAKLNPPAEPMNEEEEELDIIGSAAWEPKKKKK